MLCIQPNVIPLYTKNDFLLVSYLISCLRLSTLQNDKQEQKAVDMDSTMLNLLDDGCLNIIAYKLCYAENGVWCFYHLVHFLQVCKGVCNKTLCLYDMKKHYMMKRHLNSISKYILVNNVRFRMCATNYQNHQESKKVRKLLEHFVKKNNDKIIILSGPGGNGKTFLIFKMKNMLNEHRYDVISSDESYYWDERLFRENVLCSADNNKKIIQLPFNPFNEWSIPQPEYVSNIDMSHIQWRDFCMCDE